jgi:NADH-quinone oxidoreductase subunit E
MPFSTETQARAKEIVGRYPVGKERSALLPLLHLVQSEQGYVSPEGIGFCA